MTKKWTYEEHQYALQSAWSAFGSTLKTHGVTAEELENFFDMADAKIDKLNDYFSQAITWKEEE